MGILALAILAFLPADPVIEGIEVDLARCGVEPGQAAVAYQDHLQGYEVRVAIPLADATIECLAAASALDHLVFELSTPEQEALYNARLAERPDMVRAMQDLQASQKAWLSQRGLLDRLPVYRRGGDLAAYAAGIEGLCGSQTGEMFHVDETALTLQLQGQPHDLDQVICLMAALAVSAPEAEGVSVGLVGGS